MNPSAESAKNTNGPTVTIIGQVCRATMHLAVWPSDRQVRASDVYGEGLRQLLQLDTFLLRTYSARNRNAAHGVR